MFEKVLKLHDPKDKRSHSILRFFSEDLTEDLKIQFIKLIFKEGSWTLPAQICRTSNSSELTDETTNVFKLILNEWVSERIEHSNSRLSSETKNPYLPKKYSFEFREAIIAIKDLGFHPELMLIINRFLNECYKTYLDKFIDRTFWLIIEGFNNEELETFFLHFSNLYIESTSNNIGNFLSVFLRNLSNSPKIYFLSEHFTNNLKQLAYKIKNSGNLGNYSSLISFLLIDFITFKELDLSKKKYVELITPSIKGLERGNLDNLEFLSFLKRFNYLFESYNFKDEINGLLYSIEANIKKFEESEETTKKAILHHFVRSSNEYLELLVFKLEFLNSKDRIIELSRFITLIDRLRSNFHQLMWFKEYNEFSPIKGEITEALTNGFGVELDSCYVNEFLKKQTFNDLKEKEFVENNLFGFVNKRTFKKGSDSNAYHAHLKGNQLKSSYQKKAVKDSISEIDLFHISSLNYSSSNKGSVINLIPFSESIYRLICAFKIESFFSCIDLFLVNEAFNFLNIITPFRNRNYTPIYSRIFPSTLRRQVRLDFVEDKFWDFLKETRINLYNETYAKVKEKERRFNELIEVHNENKTIIGTIHSRTTGGFFVDIEGFDAFLPGSQIDNYAKPNYDSYLDKTMNFKIVKIYHENNSIVISHKVINEEESEKSRKSIVRKLEKGLILSGIVKNITSYGVFMDLGGIDGLIYISNLSWLKVSHPKEVVQMYQKLDVIVIDFDLSNNKIDLGLKQLQPHPWDDAREKIKKNTLVKGKVLEILPIGILIEIYPGVNGLALKANIVADLYTNIKVADELRVKIIFIDFAYKKIRLSIGSKDLNQNISINNIVEGTVIKKNKGTGIIKVKGVKGITIICPARYMKKKDGKNVELKDRVKFKILEIDKSKSRYIVSHTDTFKPKPQI